MNLLLCRHCEAESGERNDCTRQLTETGKRQAREMGAFLARQIGRVDLVITSWFARARDTAVPMAAALGCERIEETPMLEPDRSAGEAWMEINLLRTLHDASTVLVVTHHPLIGDLLRELTGAVTDEMPQGAVASVDDLALRWLVTPKLVERDEPAVVEAALGVAEAMLSALGGGDWDSLTEEQYREAVKNKQGTYTYEEILQKRVLPGESASGTCEDCQDNIDAGWIDSEDVYDTGDDGPPFHPNAVLSGSTFLPYGRLQRMVSAEFEAMAVSLDAGDYATTIGPNHPMLTARGLVQAKLLKVGDQLVYDRRAVDALSALRSEHTDFNNVHLVQDVFQSLRPGLCGTRVPPSSDDFHGDIVAGDIEIQVILPDWVLTQELNPGALKELTKEKLVLPDVHLTPEADLRLFDEQLRRFLLTSTRSMSGSDVCHFDLLTIKAIRTIAMKARAFDATTESGWYCSDGFVVSNCTCSEIYRSSRKRVKV